MCYPCISRSKLLWLSPKRSFWNGFNLDWMIWRWHMISQKIMSQCWSEESLKRIKLLAKLVLEWKISNNLQSKLSKKDLKLKLTKNLSMKITRCSHWKFWKWSDKWEKKEQKKSFQPNKKQEIFIRAYWTESERKRSP